MGGRSPSVHKSGLYGKESTFCFGLAISLYRLLLLFLSFLSSWSLRSTEWHRKYVLDLSWSSWEIIPNRWDDWNRILNWEGELCRLRSVCYIGDYLLLQSNSLISRTFLQFKYKSYTYSQENLIKFYSKDIFIVPYRPLIKINRIVINWRYGFIFWRESTNMSQ